MKLEKDIGIFEHFLSDDECDFFIDLYENKAKNGFTVNRQDRENASSINKADTTFSINVYDESPGNIKDEIDNFIKNFWVNGYSKYSEKYPTLSKRTCDILGFNLQKTLPGEGYHVWHDEHELPYLNSARVAAYIIYLNDDYEAGETEFLSQNMRIIPKKGTLALFPCNYTHAHRGNPPLSGEKYILTGWVQDIS